MKCCNLNLITKKRITFTEELCRNSKKGILVFQIGLDNTLTPDDCFMVALFLKIHIFENKNIQEY